MLWPDQGLTDWEIDCFPLPLKEVSKLGENSNNQPEYLSGPSQSMERSVQ